MYYSRKNPLQEIPTEMTDIWVCTDSECNGWMRNDYALAEEPVCSQCKSPMTRGQKELPVLDYAYSSKGKAAKKK
ncbi:MULTISPECIES: cold-shock protein [Paenibacillus]|jgi:hypothetical protein|uniref:Cold-shock protein n=1 Tax=Paenibacillus bovis TaxID=1616788 RepID=A0A172ZD73_9BACL|nr:MULTISPECIES: cold-inducible protein YdjO-related protein [Paenibacillus]ANF95302.1 hypothetical protein AR543_04250 [Paenibacillus bovis]